MRTVTLVLTTPTGDELGRKPLDDIVLSPTGEIAESGSTPGMQMRDLYSHVESQIAAEGMQIAVDRLDFQLSVSRALLDIDDDTDPVIRVPVCASSSDGSDSDAKSGSDTNPMDDIFNLGSSDEGTTRP